MYTRKAHIFVQNRGEEDFHSLELSLQHLKLRSRRGKQAKQRQKIEKYSGEIAAQEIALDQDAEESEDRGHDPRLEDQVESWGHEVWGVSDQLLIIFHIIIKRDNEIIRTSEAFTNYFTSKLFIPIFPSQVCASPNLLAFTRPISQGKSCASTHSQ